MTYAHPIKTLIRFTPERVDALLTKPPSKALDNEEAFEEYIADTICSIDNVLAVGIYLINHEVFRQAMTPYIRDRIVCRLACDRLLKHIMEK